MSSTHPAPASGTLRCDHCLTELPAREAVTEAIDGATRVFCCGGCRGVYRLLADEGLSTYYASRRWDGPGAPVGEGAGVPDLAAFREGVRRRDGGDEVELHVAGIRCASCVWLIERLLLRTPGVLAARMNYATDRARVRWDPARADLAAVLSRIRAAGYEPRPWSDSAQAAARRAETRDLLVRLGTAAFLASQLMIYQAALYAGYFQGIDAATRKLMEWISLGLTLPIYFYSGAPFLRATWAGLRRGAPGMDALVAIGSGAALVTSVWQMLRGGEVYFDTAAMIPTLVLVGRYVEAAAKGRASEAVARLAALTPREARRLERTAGGALRRSVPVGEVAVGDRLEIVPGERIPLDGEVEEGASEVDESLVTGEARPVAKAPGARVIGGTVNLHGALVVRVTRVGKETVLAGIVRAVEEAQAAKPRIQAVADRAVGVFVPVMLALAAGTFAWWRARGAPLDQAMMTAISVVVIACPCALGLATPIAVVVATGLASARGLLVRGGDVLERAARMTDVLLDKTGTATRGRPVLREVVALDAILGERGALALAAVVERQSEHHVGRAIVEAARGRGIELRAGVREFRAVPGKGVVARIHQEQVEVEVQVEVQVEVHDPQNPFVLSVAPAQAGAESKHYHDHDLVLLGNRALLEEHGVDLPAAVDALAREREARGETVAFLAVGGKIRAFLAVADVLRDEAPGAVRDLLAQGLSVAVVSGDGPGATGAAAGALGVAWIAEATPQEKREEVERRQRAGQRVLFAGDGVNDAPALGQAEVGVAMGRGTDVTMESADVVLVRDDLRLLADLVRLSRRTLAAIRQNVFWAFFYNAVAIPLAMAGLLHPIVAAAAMAASSLFVVGNSLRLRRALG